MFILAIFSIYLTKIREYKVRPYIKGKVLDIGCGEAKAINNKAVTKYFGVDFDYKCIKLTKKYPSGVFISKNLEYDEIDIPEKVDLVLMTAFIEHLNNYKNPIKQSIKNLKRGGRILLTTPTRFGNLVHSCISATGLFPKSVRKAHKNVFSKKDFIKMAKIFNLKLIKYKKFEFLCNQLIIFKK